MVKIIGNKFLYFFIGLLLITVSSGCSSEDEKAVIKIGYLPITHATPLFLHQEMHGGIDDEYEVELVRFSSWPDLMDALNAGRIDGASVLIQLAMKAMEKGIDLSAVALGHQDGNVLISQKGVNSIQEMDDKTFAIPHTYSTQHLLLQELLTLEGIAYEDVDMIELPPAEMPVALSEDRISGYIVAEPFGALGVRLDIGEVLAFSEAFWPNSYCCVLVIRDDFIENEFDLTKQFVSEYVEAGIKADKKEEALYTTLQEYINVEKETLHLSLEWITFNDLSIKENEYNRIYESVIDLELIESPPTYEEFVDHRFVDWVKTE